MSMKEFLEYIYMQQVEQAANVDMFARDSYTSYGIHRNCLVRRVNNHVTFHPRIFPVKNGWSCRQGTGES